MEMYFTLIGLYCTDIYIYIYIFICSLEKLRWGGGEWCEMWLVDGNHIMQDPWVLEKS